MGGVNPCPAGKHHNHFIHAKRFDFELNFAVGQLIPDWRQRRIRRISGESVVLFICKGKSRIAIILWLAYDPARIIILKRRGMFEYLCFLQ